MVLESLVRPKLAEQRPFRMIFLGILYASVAMYLSLWIFREHASLVMVFLTVIASIPLMYHIIKYEEKKDLKKVKELFLLKEHSKALLAFIFLFIGFTFAFSMWYIFLPQGSVGDVFSLQTQTIQEINSRITGLTVNAASVSSRYIFGQIVTNNLKVLLFCIFFSFFYGAGAIFILTWNSSVISAALGNFVRSHVSQYAGSFGFSQVANYFQVYSVGVIRYAIHGLPEMLSYFVGGLAGSIISIAVIRHDFGTPQFKKVLFDSLDLILIAVGLVFVSGFIEVYITPAVFNLVFKA